MELKELKELLKELLRLSREIQRLVEEVDPQKVYSAILRLREVYVEMGGGRTLVDPLTFWTELVSLETYLSPEEREALRPFKKLIEISLSGLSKKLEQKVISFLATLMPNGEQNHKLRK